MGGMISGLDKMRKMNPGNLAVFAVGASSDKEEIREQLKEQNHLEETPFYYLEGGFDFEKMSFFPKMMLKMMRKSIAKKEEKTQQDIEMEQLLSGSFDNSDKRKIEPFIKLLQNDF